MAKRLAALEKLQVWISYKLGDQSLSYWAARGGVLTHQCLNAIVIDALAVVKEITALVTIRHCLRDQDFSYWYLECFQLAYTHLRENSSPAFRWKTELAYIREWQIWPKVLQAFQDEAQISPLQPPALWRDTSVHTREAHSPREIHRRVKKKGRRDKMILGTKKATRLIATHQA